MEKSAYLILEDGHVFRGEPFGAEREVTAEVVFATGMGGYIETLTDKSYYGQTVVQTFPLIGNYGVMEEDFEGDIIGPSGYIVREWCRYPSNFRSQGDIDSFLRERNIPGVCGVDTRAITKIIREKGTMNGMIAYSPDAADFDKLRAYSIIGSVPAVSCRSPYAIKAERSERHVALLDFGLKMNIVRELVKRGCDVTVYPYNTPVSDIMASGAQGVMLSNGPGDPTDNPEIVKNISEIMNAGIPLFGVCLGHQLLALASGFLTEKLKYGHHGENQPSKNLESGRVYITAQNHDYAVRRDSVDPVLADELFINVNDNTCEGIRYKGRPVFSVQFHPEASAGPRDTAFLFDEFIKMMEADTDAAR